MKTTKHWLATIAVLLCSVSVSAHDFEVDGIFYKITSQADLTVAVTYEGSYYSYSEEYADIVALPSIVSYKNVKYVVEEIDADAFHGCSNLISITIPDGVKSIGDYAFYGCSNLTAVILPDDVEYIGSSAFDGCSSLTAIDMPTCITRIEHRTFYGCSSLISIDIPTAVTSLGQYAFYGCSSLTSIIVPSNVKVLEDGAFCGCSQLASIDISDSVVEIGSNACLGTSWFNKQPNGLVYAGNVLYKYKGTMPANTSIVVKEGTVGIANSIFAYNYANLVSVSLPNSIVNIGENAFSHCTNLESINIPNSITKIGSLTFRNCTSLASIEIPTSVTSIGHGAFMNTAWFNNQPDGVVYLGNWLIGYKGTMPAYTSIDVKEGTKGIADQAFMDNANLYSIAIPDEVKNLGTSTFMGCTNLNFVTIGNGVKSIDDYVFTGCTSLISVEIGKNVTYIGACAFDGCENLTSLVLPSKLTSIGESAFCGCEKLTYMDIPIGVTSIGSYAFYNCSNLIVERIPDGVVSIEDYTFCNCVSLESVAVGNIVKRIGNCAFSGCSKLKSAPIGKGVISIGDCAFSGCENLISLSFPIGLTAIGEYAFGECVGLTSIVIPKTVRYIGNNAFGGCYGFTSVTCKAINPPMIGVSEGMDVSLGIDIYIPLFVPASSISIYGSAEYWREFIDVRSIIPNHFVIEEPNIGDDFIITENKDCESITYTRTFNNTNWQALYVPFEIPYENIKDDFDVAYIYDTRQYDNDGDGVKDETVIESFVMKSGVLSANYPYLIRAKEVGEKTITVSDATLYATEEVSIDCSSVFDTYAFTGTYSRMSSEELPQGEGYYALSGGVWRPVADGSSLGAFRFYLKVDSRSGSTVANARSIRMRVMDEDSNVEETTNIDDAQLSMDETPAAIYDLQGRCVENPAKGIYVVNGKKVMIK